MSADNLWNPKHKAFIGENNPMNSTGTTVKPLELNKHTTAEELLDWIHSLPRDNSMQVMVEERVNSWVKVCQIPVSRPNGYPIIQGVHYLEIQPETPTAVFVAWLLRLPRWEEGCRLAVAALNNWAKARKAVVAN